MKNLLLLPLLLLIKIANASVQSGEPIKAIEFNNRTFTIGDIKHSILSLNEFQTLHGNCWIQFNNSSQADISIQGSDLAALKNTLTIKSAAGRVLRAAGGLAAPLNQTQEDLFKSHNHGGGDHNHAISRGWLYGRSGVTNNSIAVGGDATNYGSNALNSSGTIISTEGGDETRMKNLSVNMFIKINHKCD